MQTYLSKFSVVKALVLASSLSLALTSCQDEEFGYDISDVRESVYARNFTELFGEVDPNHTWNMAQCAHVNINVSGATGYQVRILTEVPTNRETILLYAGVMTSDNLEVDVDVVRGSQYLYVELSSGFGVTLVDGYYPIAEDGTVMVNRTTTRMAGDVAPAVKLYEYDIKRISRIWNPGSENDKKYWDWGFQPNVTFPVKGDVNTIPEDWYVSFPTANGNEERSGDNGGSGWVSASRLLSIGSKSKAFNNSSTQPTVALYLRGDKNVTNGQVLATAQYLGRNGKYVFIPSGPTKIHIPLARWQHAQDSENQEVLQVTAIRVDDKGVEHIDSDSYGRADDTFYSIPATANNVGQDVTFSDKTLIFNAEGGYYYFKLQLHSKRADKGIICGGIQVEPIANRDEKNSTTPPYRPNLDKDHPYVYTDGSGFSHYVEHITGGYIGYHDVLGGTVNRYKTPYLKYLNGGTPRWNAKKTTFKYDTYDVNQMFDTNGVPQIGIGSFGPFYIIDDNSTDKDRIVDHYERMKYRDLFPLFGLYKDSKSGTYKKGPFREGENHIDPYFTQPGHHTATTGLEMSLEPSIVTLGHATDENGVAHDGSVMLKMVGMGTNWSNAFGYFYYPSRLEGELMTGGTLDFNRIPKIIIRHNMQQALDKHADQPSSGGYDGSGDIPYYGLQNFQFSRYIDACYMLGLYNPTDEAWLRNDSNLPNPYSAKELYDKFKDSQYRDKIANAGFEAPVFKLPFYGWQQNSDGKYVPTGTPTYDWGTEEYVIGFFGIREDDNTACELARIYTSSASVQLNQFNDMPRCSTFSYKGKNYIGIEDEIDYDNNDLLFEIQGVKPTTPDITPPDDVTPLSSVQRWVVACEDLGGSWDYDFNDLVWEVSKEIVPRKENSGWVTDTKISWRPLAAGGTLEAIVQYNDNSGLDASEATTGWRDLGEIHNLVKRTPEKSNGSYQTPTNKQLNVTPGVNPTQNECGDEEELIKLTNDAGNNWTMANVLTHFRVKVVYPDGKSYIVRNVGKNLQGQSDHKHDGNHDYPTDSKVPQFILLPRGWRWPAEAVCIDNAYPSFTDWTKSQGNYPNWVNDWNNAHGNGDGAVIINPFRD